MKYMSCSKQTRAAGHASSVTNRVCCCIACPCHSTTQRNHASVHQMILNGHETNLEMCHMDEEDVPASDCCCKGRLA